MGRLFAGSHSLARKLSDGARLAGPEMELRDGDRIAVIGGGPAGSFFSYFLLRLADNLDLKLNVELYEPRRFEQAGPGGCNHCGGIISESLVQLLAMDGINVPPAVTQRAIDGYVLHTDVGQVRIETPLHEKRIAAVYRGGGPKRAPSQWQSFDKFLLDLACAKGARVRHQLVSDIEWTNGRPWLAVPGGPRERYDLVIVGAGVNSRLLERFEALGMGFSRPLTTTAFITEFNLGREAIERTFGSAMHVFLLDMPRLEFAALIPKDESLTLALLGEDIDQDLVEAFLNAPEVERMFPLDTGVPGQACHCFPRINIDGAPQPFAERMLFIGDAGVTRLYKDGIGAAYRTAKAAATAALLGGVSAEDLRRHFWPACRAIRNDNAIGKVVFFVSGLIQHARFSRRAMIEMTASEQASPRPYRPMSGVLWDIFTGSAPYREIFLRTLDPRFIGRLAWNLALSVVPLNRKPG
jgi:flavin-dependent dehydrogenase